MSNLFLDHLLSFDGNFFYRLVIKEHMQYIIEHADEIEKLIKVKAQVSEVKNIMLDNIEKVRRIKCGIQNYWALGLISGKKNKERGRKDI